MVFSDVGQAEAGAVLEGPKFAKGLNLLPLIVGQEAANAVNMYNGVLASIKEIDNIINDIKELIAFFLVTSMDFFQKL